MALTLKEHLTRIAPKGGKASAARLTKEQRIARATKASRSRKCYKKRPTPLEI